MARFLKYNCPLHQAIVRFIFHYLLSQNFRRVCKCCYYYYCCSYYTCVISLTNSRSVFVDLPSASMFLRGHNFCFCLWFGCFASRLRLGREVYDVGHLERLKERKSLRRLQIRELQMLVNVCLLSLISVSNAR